MSEQKRLKAELEKRGITIYKMAKECDIPASSAYNMVSGRLCAYPGYRKKISSFLGMSESELFED